MARQNINLGTAPGGLDGDDARTAFTKTNANFTELYGGTVLQPLNAKLSAISESVWAANQLMLTTGAGTLAMLETGATGRALIATADPAAGRTALAALGIGQFGFGSVTGSPSISTAAMDATDTANGIYRLDVTGSAWKGLPVDVYAAWINRLNTTTASVQIAVSFSNGKVYTRGSTAQNFENSVKPSDLGNAAYATLTTTGRDNVAGRVMKVGDHGIGTSTGNMSAGAALGDLIAHGLFSANDPVPPDWSDTMGTYPMGLTLYRSALVRTQLAMSYGNLGAAGLYRRDMSAAGWRAWSKLLEKTDIVGAVSQAAGIPTGAIIERGSNANGDYVRFADGTQICWGKTVARPCATLLPGGSGLYYNTTTSYSSYPMGFVSPPVVSANAVRVNGSDGSVSQITGSEVALGGNTVTPQFRGFSHVNGSQIQFNYVAVGRWF